MNQSLNQWSSKKIPLTTLPSGHELDLSVYHLKSNKNGPKVYLQSSVHGAEVQGNLVLLELMNYFKNSPLLCGEITMVPLANPYATNHKMGTYTYGRFNPTTGDNWNRLYLDILKLSNFDLVDYVSSIKNLTWDEIKTDFKKTLRKLFESLKDHPKFLSENFKLNYTLQLLSLDHDVMLDLHTGPVACRYLYVAEYEQPVARYLPFDCHLLMPHEFAGAMDEAFFIPWTRLQEELQRQTNNPTRFQDLDIYSFTLEFGSEEKISSLEAKDDAKRILNFLKFLKMIEGEAQKFSPDTRHLTNFKTLYAPVAGLCEILVKPGAEFKQNEVLAKIYQFQNLDPHSPFSCIKEIKAQGPGKVINHYPSSIIQKGAELIQYCS
jgi:predicted deacylase